MSTAELLSAMLEALRVQAVRFEALRVQAVRVQAVAVHFEALRAQAVHFLEAQENERLRAQYKDSAQRLEQENERLRIQAEIEPDYTVAARQGALQELGQPTTDAVAATEPETGVRETDTTAAAKIFAVMHQDHYILHLEVDRGRRADGQHAQRAGVARVHDRPAPARLRHQERLPHRLLPRHGQGWPPRTHPD